MSEYVMSSIVKTFLTDTITSVAQLELLLLLRTSYPKCWTIDQLVAELRVERGWAAQQLELFRGAGLATRDEQSPPAYCYGPATSQLEQTVSAVAQDYLLHRVSVTEFIYSKPSATLRAFADAFRLRKDPPNG